MKLNKKETIIVTALISCLILPSMTIFGLEGSNIEPQRNYLLSESPLENVTVEMITNLASHRSDGIPSIRPGGSFTAQFNITNYSSQDLNDFEVDIATNDFGQIIDPLNIPKNTLSINESQLTPEYLIETSDLSGVGSNALDLVILLDQSSSMDEEIDVLTNELIGVIETISNQVPDVRIGLILFGGRPNNSYTNPELVYDLTSNVQDIVDVLSETKAGGGIEPWGDSLWVAQNWLDWREDVVKLLVLITDEPCDGGVMIGDGSMVDYDGPELYQLFEDLHSQDFILCTIIATGDNDLTVKQLTAGAEYTGGTCINLNTGDRVTSDIPEIIGELIVFYAVELDLKIFVDLSFMNDLDEIESLTYTFVVLLDELPPEIDTWTYLSEDFMTDESFINIMCEVKDVTGVSFVEIYYKFNTISFWITANATHTQANTYILSVPLSISSNSIKYYIYTEDWLGNTITSEISEVDLKDIFDLQTIESGKRKEIYLMPNQSVVCRLPGNSIADSYGIMFSDYYDPFDVIAADLNISDIVLNAQSINYKSILIQKNHIIKISLRSQEETSVIVANVIPEMLEFQQKITREISETDAYMFKIDNNFTRDESRGFLADSQVVMTELIVFDANTWEVLDQSYTFTYLPEKEVYVLVYATYHTGEITITFDFVSAIDTYEHYYEETPINFFIIVISIFSFAAIISIIKRRG